MDNDLFSADYLVRKEARRREFNRTAGVKLIVCAACSGSGYYDNGGDMYCGACDGVGKCLPYIPPAK